jgi:NADPH:quinone reductase-like Zn-dependent oxidoreductase
MSTAPSARAWQYASTTGGLEKALKLNSVMLQPNPNQHLVKVIATALNPVDYKPAEVALIRRFLIPNPATPGIDLVGRLVAPAAGSPLQTGQLVFGAAGKSPMAGGALAELALAEKDNVIAVPEGLDPIDAASLGVASLTAYQTIVPHVKKGDRVLINGGSGGTGVFGIQIAKSIGCHVTTTCSTANVELCKRLGADEVVDYRKQSVIEALKANGHVFHHIVDNVGSDPQLYFRCHEFSTDNAAYVMVAGTLSLAGIWMTLTTRLWPSFLGGGKRKIMGFLTKANPTELQQIGNWGASGTIRAVIDSRFPFEDAPAAFAKLKTGRARGKIVVEVHLEG